MDSNGISWSSVRKPAPLRISTLDTRADMEESETILSLKSLLITSTVKFYERVVVPSFSNNVIVI